MSVFNYLGSSTIERYGDNGNVWVKIYNNTGSAINNGTPKALVEMFISGKGVVLVPVAIDGAVTTKSIVIGIIDNSVAGAATIPDASYGWALVKGLYGSTTGNTYGLATSSTVTANDLLEINANAPTAAVDSGVNGGALHSTASAFAVAVANVTTDVWQVYLLGIPVTIAAS